MNSKVPEDVIERVKTIMDEKHAELLKHINTLKPTFLVGGRKKVWDHLSYTYSGTEKKLWIIGEGADSSNPEINKDISELVKATDQILEKGKEIHRVQTVDTWVKWFEMQIGLKKKYPKSFKLFLTNERIKFSPQVNIRDESEVVLVPPEETAEYAYAIRIAPSNEDAIRAIRKNCSDFEKLCSEQMSCLMNNPETLRKFAELLKMVKEIQIECLVACEFQDQKKRGEMQFAAPTYPTIQNYFTLDHAIYLSYFNSKKIKELRTKFKDFRKKNNFTLGETFCHIYPDKYTKNAKLDYLKMAKQICISAQAGKFTHPEEVSAVLQRKDVRNAARELAEYFSDVLMYGARRMTSKTE